MSFILLSSSMQLLYWTLSWQVILWSHSGLTGTFLMSASWNSKLCYTSYVFHVLNLNFLTIVKIFLQLLKVKTDLVAKSSRREAEVSHLCILLVLGKRHCRPFHAAVGYRSQSSSLAWERWLPSRDLYSENVRVSELLIANATFTLLNHFYWNRCYFRDYYDAMSINDVMIKIATFMILELSAATKVWHAVCTWSLAQE